MMIQLPMNLQPSFVKYVVNPAFFALWQVLYALVAAFLFVARIGLAIKELGAIAVDPQEIDGLNVRRNAFETPTP